MSVKYFAASGEWRVSGDELLARPWEAVARVNANEWVVEVAIPFAALDVEGPKPGQTWRANFLRRFRDFKIPESYWARIKSGWGDAERYGVLRFL